MVTPRDSIAIPQRLSIIFRFDNLPLVSRGNRNALRENETRKACRICKLRASFLFVAARREICLMKSTRPSDIDRRQFIKSGLAVGANLSIQAAPQASSPPPAGTDRDYWIQILKRISSPVLDALRQRQLRQRMPVETAHGNAGDRSQFTHLEAMGRLLCGVAPWLESGLDAGEEGKLRSQFAEWSREAIRSATEPSSPDFMNFNKGQQPLVDTAFLALAILRAPTELWRKLDGPTQKNIVAALEASRPIKPGFNNWILFSAMVEAALCFMGASWDQTRVDYAVRTVDSWYKGDGLYGDGPIFHWDYYNSFVIHPMLLKILDVVSKSSPAWNAYRAPALARAQRYAAIQERLIAPDAAFPCIGRSLCYRFGAFHLLAEMALRRQLPEGVSPAQVRGALTAVMRRMLSAPGTFDDNGWLRLGFYGHQPSIAEPYISTGSLYLCSAAWLPLGLPPADPFWSSPAQPWTSQRVWSGDPIPPDHAMTEKPS
jgi:hypothetical protein